MKVFFFFFLCFFTCQWVLLYLEFCLVYNIDIVFLKVLIKISKWRFYFFIFIFFTISVTDIKERFHLHMSLMAIVKDWGRGLRGLRGLRGGLLRVRVSPVIIHTYVLYFTHLFIRVVKFTFLSLVVKSHPSHQGLHRFYYIF